MVGISPFAAALCGDDHDTTREFVMPVDKAMICSALPLVIEGLESLSDLPFFQGWAPRALRVLALADKLYCGGQDVFGIDEVLDEDELDAAKMLAAEFAAKCPCDGGECGQ